MFNSSDTSCLGSMLASHPISAHSGDAVDYGFDGSSVSL